MKTTIRTSLVTLSLLLAAITLSAQPQRGNGMQNQTPEQTAAMQTERMSKALNLTDTQKEQIQKLYLESAKQFAETRKDNQTSREDRMAQMKDYREKQNLALKKILNDEQYKNWEKIQQERADQRRR